ncbi:hypothetical protein Patl1_22757 [Pistacia atlantica]|uniref:Uncharacterized protein n=1 Tax=Pistacia atlantica TaxID=434234 RepID=A0ACC0ZY81_9ROSI|nr:hypothetical protein Patl1_22757 [Pistacia atlantica]
MTIISLSQKLGTYSICCLQLKSAYAIAKLRKTGYSKQKFYKEAVEMYKEINTLMASGDKTSIRKAVTENMYSALKNEIKQRESMWSKVYWELVEPIVKIRTLRARLATAQLLITWLDTQEYYTIGVDQKDLNKVFIQLTLEFLAKQKFEAYDSKGAVVAGDKTKEVGLMVLVRDIWVFEKSLFHPGAYWRLCGRIKLAWLFSGEIEHKTNWLQGGPEAVLHASLSVMHLVAFLERYIGLKKTLHEEGEDMESKTYTDVPITTSSTEEEALQVLEDTDIDAKIQVQREEAPPDKAPKKMVSINENVETIKTSKKRNKKPKRQEAEQQMPLKSILKAPSDASNSQEPQRLLSRANEWSKWVLVILLFAFPPPLIITLFLSPAFRCKTKSKSNFPFNPIYKDRSFNNPLQRIAYFPQPIRFSGCELPSKVGTLKCGKVRQMESQEGVAAITNPMRDLETVDEDLVQQMVCDALVWSSLHGLVVGDKNVQRSGRTPGVGMVHAPFALLPLSFPESYYSQACELAPIFNELVDRVSLDGNFLQGFTDQDIRLGLHRSDYMLDEHTKLLLQIELNTISCSFPGLGTIVSELHRSLLIHYGEHLGLDSKKIPGNSSVSRFAEAMAKAWTEYNNPRAVVMVVAQSEERNMYDQHWLCSKALYKVHIQLSFLSLITHTMLQLFGKHWLKLICKGNYFLMEHFLCIGGQAVSVVYFRAGYAPTDYPSESEWRARLLMEQSSAIKCPSISYHLAGTKKIQQELAKPNVLERFLDNKEDIAKVRKCFAGLWSLDDSEIVGKAIERPELYVMKPQREGGGPIFLISLCHSFCCLQLYTLSTGGNNVFEQGSEEDAAYILMQRIFPSESLAYLMRDGVCHKDQAISELGIYGAYLRNKDKVIMNEQCGYLMRTKISSSNEGGVAAGFAVLDSIYLT